MLFFACATALVMPPQVRLDILVDFFDPVGPSLLVYHSGPADIKRFSFVVREGKDGPRVPLLHAGPSNVFAVLTQEGGAGIGGVTGRRKKKWGARSAGWAERELLTKVYLKHSAPLGKVLCTSDVVVTFAIFDYGYDQTKVAGACESAAEMAAAGKKNFALFPLSAWFSSQHVRHVAKKRRQGRGELLADFKTYRHKTAVAKLAAARSAEEAGASPSVVAKLKAQLDAAVAATKYAEAGRIQGKLLALKAGAARSTRRRRRPVPRKAHMSHAQLLAEFRSFLGHKNTIVAKKLTPQQRIRMARDTRHTAARVQRARTPPPEKTAPASAGATAVERNPARVRISKGTKQGGWRDFAESIQKAQHHEEQLLLHQTGNPELVPGSWEERKHKHSTERVEPKWLPALPWGGSADGRLPLPRQHRHSLYDKLQFAKASGDASDEW